MRRRTRRTSVNPWWVFAATSISVLLVYINASALALALPDMSRDLNASSSQANWFLLSYMLTTTALILVFGRITDVIGRRPLYVSGVLVFLAASLWSGLATDPVMLIVARLVQGVGGAATVTNVSALLTDVFPRRTLAIALGMNVTTIGVGQVLGPLVGGLVVDSAGWRWLFLGSVPLGLVGLIASLVVLPRATRGTAGEGFDLWGALTSIAAVSALVMAISTAGTDGWTAPLAWGSALVCALMGTVFVMIQRKAREPLVHPIIFSDRRAVIAFTNALLGSTASFAGVLLASLVLQASYGLTPSETSWAILPSPAGTILASLCAGVILRKISAHLLSAAGLALIGAGAAFFAAVLFLPQPSYLLLAAALGISGVGVGLFMTPNTSLLMLNLAVERRGIGNAVRAAMHNGGYLLSTALALAISTSGLPQDQRAAAYQGTLLDLGPAANQGFVTGTQMASLLFALIAFAGVAIVLIGMRRHADGSEDPPDPRPQPTRAVQPVGMS